MDELSDDDIDGYGMYVFFCILFLMLKMI